jgi:hypothetical protein
VNKSNELIFVIPKYSVKCYDHRSVSQLGYRHLSHVTPPASTSGETASASQVLSKGSVVRVLLVRCLSVEPWVCPCANIFLEVAYQTVTRGISKELKAAQKKVWPTFPF